MLLSRQHLPIVLSVQGIVPDISSIKHGIFSFPDQCLELGSLPLFLIKFALKSLINALAGISFFFSIIFVIFLGHVVDELEGVKQDVFLPLAELLISVVIGFRFLLNLIYFSQMNGLLKHLKAFGKFMFCFTLDNAWHLVLTIIVVRQ